MVAFALGLALGSLSVTNESASPNRDYLSKIARDTWACIDSLVEPATGLPYDNDSRGEFTSTSNIGIYLTCVGSAEKLGILPRAEAISRIRASLKSTAKLKTWFGFQQTWNGVKSLQPATHDPWVSVLDSGNLCAGLITVAQLYPEVSSQAMALLNAHQWGAFYDKEQKQLLGGYNTSTNLFNKEWRLDTLGTDAALSQFLAIANDAAPPELWSKLNRRRIHWEGEEFLWPGWEGGGLFMQFISGLWLNLQGTELGNSGEAFARAQVRHMQTLKSPVWGWSACNNPDGGYLGWGALKDEVVTPHASALAVGIMEEKVVANLRKLESLGARSEKLGFYDSLDWKRSKVSKSFLLLDQGMLLVSLTNHLHENVIRRAFCQSKSIQVGLRKVAL